MSLNIKNADVSALVNEIVALTGETKTEAIRKALIERKQKLRLQTFSSEAHLQTVLEDEIWPQIPKKLLGKGVSQVEQDDLLGYGKKGV